MPSSYRLTQPQPRLKARGTALVIPCLTLVFFAEGWLAGAPPLQARHALPRAVSIAAAVTSTAPAASPASPTGALPPSALAISAVNSKGTTPNATERRRDPFRPLVRSKDEGAVPFVGPPGKAGLTVNTLQVQGTMRDPDGMTAIVANPQGHVYFLHPGDQIYDAVVQSIGPGGVVFQQHTQDAFGHPVMHIVTRLLGPASGGTP